LTIHTPTAERILRDYLGAGVRTDSFGLTENVPPTQISVKYSYVVGIVSQRDQGLVDLKEPPTVFGV
jgi:hypothetical protein